jgi:DNA polymerase-1
MAHLSGDEALSDSFEHESDIHTMTASRVFGVPAEDVTPLQRSRAKAVNFGVIYGISSFGLSEDLKISRKEAQAYIDDYFRVHPGVKAYMDSMVEFCKENNYVVTLLGRRRYIGEIHASNYMTRQLGERLAMNTPVQGTAADIMKLAMIKTYRTLNETGCTSRLILQVHDELIIDCVKEEEEKVKELLEECMTNAVQLNVVLAADVNTGSSWYDLK